MRAALHGAGLILAEWTFNKEEFNSGLSPYRRGRYRCFFGKTFMVVDSMLYKSKELIVRRNDVLSYIIVSLIIIFHNKDYWCLKSLIHLL